MKYSDVARFEFRVFGADLATVRDKLATRATGKRQPPSHETYIVSSRNAESNVKLRDGGLEVKGLQGKLRGLEQWMPVFKSPLPVAACDVENVVAPALGIDTELAQQPPLDEPALLSWIDAQPPLASVPMVKQRTLYNVDDCEAEFTEVKIGFEKVHTIAIEAPSAKDIEAVVRDIGLAGSENVSYSLYLQRQLF